MNIHQEYCKTWFEYYNQKKGIKYRMTPRDESHLKNIRKALIEQLDKPVMFDSALVLMFQTFLKKIQNPFVLSHLTLSVIDSMFNQLWAEQTQGRFINEYNASFEKTLEGDELMKYHKHLIGLGYNKSYSPTGGTKWTKLTPEK